MQTNGSIPQGSYAISVNFMTKKRNESSKLSKLKNGGCSWIKLGRSSTDLDRFQPKIEEHCPPSRSANIATRINGFGGAGTVRQDEVKQNRIANVAYRGI